MKSLTNSSVNIFRDKANLRGEEKLVSGEVILSAKCIQSLSYGLLTFAVPEVWRGIEMVYSSRHGSLLYRVVHTEVGVVVRVAHVSPVANRADFEFWFVKRTFEVVRMNIKHSFTRLRSSIVLLSAFSGTETFKSFGVIKDVGVEGVLYLVFIDGDVSQEVMYFPLMRLYLQLQLLLV